MKKFLAIVLALTMVLGMATVSMAASYTAEIIVHGDTYYTYNSDTKRMETATGTVAPGTTLYIYVENADSAYSASQMGMALPNIKTTSALKYYKVNYRVNDGKKFIEAVSNTFTTKKLSEAPNGGQGSGTYAFLTIKTGGAYTSTVDADIDVDFTLFGKVVSGSKALVNDSEEYTLNVSASLENQVTQAGSYTTIAKEAPIVNFDDIGDSEPIELYFGKDVTFIVNARGQGELYLKYSDDPVGTKFDLDGKYSSADLVYHLFDGTKKTFRRTGKLHIPARSLSNGKAPYLYQISTSGALTQVKAKYDENREEFVIDTATLNNYIVSDTALKASGTGTSTSESSSSSSTSNVPTDTPSGGGSSSSGTTTGADLAAQVTTAIQSAKASGKTNPSVDVSVNNEVSISAKDMQTIVNAAKNAGGAVRFVADTTSGSSTVGRLTLTPSSAAVVLNDIYYAVNVSGDQVNATKARFEKYYNNNIVVVSLGQNGSYGFPVSVAAEINVGSLNTKALKFYSYNRSTGKYFAISAPGYWFDANGYVHFNTTQAGDIIITDKALAAK